MRTFDRRTTIGKCDYSSPERGYRVGVTITGQIPDGGQDRDRSLYDFAHNLRVNRWNLPSKPDCDDTILMLSSNNHSDVFISTATISSKVLTNCIVSEIIRLKTNFQRTPLEQDL